jgi:hypothetical protein
MVPDPLVPTLMVPDPLVPTLMVPDPLVLTFNVPNPLVPIVIVFDVTLILLGTNKDDKAPDIVEEFVPPPAIVLTPLVSIIAAL